MGERFKLETVSQTLDTSIELKINLFKRFPSPQIENRAVELLLVWILKSLSLSTLNFVYSADISIFFLGNISKLHRIHIFFK